MADPAYLEDGTLIEPETGEVLHEGDTLASLGDPGDLVRWLAAQFVEAQAQVKAWEARRSGLSRMIAARATEARFEAGDSRISIVPASTRYKSHRDLVDRAFSLGLVTWDEAEAVTSRAARELDAATVRAWIAGLDEERREDVALAMLESYEVRSYPRATPILRDARRRP